MQWKLTKSKIYTDMQMDKNMKIRNKLRKC